MPFIKNCYRNLQKFFLRKEIYRVCKLGGRLYPEYLYLDVCFKYIIRMIKNSVFIGWHKDNLPSIELLDFIFLQEPMIRVEILQQFKLPEYLLVKYKENHYLNDPCWDAICEFQDLSEKFMRDNITMMNFYYISGCQNLSEGFLIDYYPSIFWRRLGKYELTELIMRAYYRELDWYKVLKTSEVPQDLYQELLEKGKIKADWL